MHIFNGLRSSQASDGGGVRNTAAKYKYMPVELLRLARRWRDFSLYAFWKALEHAESTPCSAPLGKTHNASCRADEIFSWGGRSAHSGAFLAHLPYSGGGPPVPFWVLDTYCKHRFDGVFAKYARADCAWCGELNPECLSGDGDAICRECRWCLNDQEIAERILDLLQQEIKHAQTKRRRERKRNRPSAANGCAGQGRGWNQKDMRPGVATI
jgi:uncharacterized small protein (DUF1192 family)